MSDAIRLEYADGRRSWSGPAILAMVLGLCSGPITVVLVRLTGIAYGISIVGSGVSGIVGLSVAAYCVWAYARLRTPPRPRGRPLAMVGLVATLAWTVGLIVLFQYIETQLN